MNNRWVANKFDLINFWYYDEQEYELADGKIIFRGSNGSGKSVTTQSFIPLLLDGDKKPSRIDPFRSNSRKLENYLLMDENEDDRTAYLYLEFFKKETNSYLTLGMGLRARKGKSLESWYFILKDGRRIGKEFSLYENKGEKYCLTNTKLKNKLGDGNYYGNSQGEYMRKVNEHLYGYSDIEDYKDLLNLLIELRSPKLSKDFKPTKIYEILNKALGTLSDEDLIVMSEAMDNMDSLQNTLDQSIMALKNSREIEKVFMEYNRAIIYNKAKNYIDKEKSITKEEKTLSNVEIEISNKNECKEKLKVEIRELENYLDKIKLEESALKENDGFKIKAKIEEIKSKIQLNKLELHKKVKIMEDKERTRKALERNIVDLEYKQEKELVIIEELLDEEYLLKEEIYFDYIGNLRDKINSSEFNFKGFIDSFESYSKIVDRIYQLILKYDNEKRNKENKESVYYIKNKELSEYKKKYNEALEYLTSIKSEYLDNINKYLQSTIELHLSEEEKINIFKLINDIEKVNDLYKYINQLDNVLKVTEDNYEKEIFKKEEEKKSKLELIKDKENEIIALEESKENLNEEEDIKKLKEILAENSIDYMEFFKLIDFKEGLEEKDRVGIESALDGIGYLKALVIPKKYKEKALAIVKDNNYKLIFSDEKEVKNNIEQYFRIEDNDFTKNYSEDILRILKSIGIGKSLEGEIKINLDYSYSLGIMEGRAEKEYELKYIGAQSRENYIENQKKILLEEIEAIKDNIYIIDKEIESIEREIEIFREERNSFPKSEDIKYALEMIDNSYDDLNKKENEYNLAKDELSKASRKYEEIKAQFYNEKNVLRIPNDLNKYNEIREIIVTYRVLINELKDKKFIFDSLKEKETAEKSRLEDIKDDLDNINDDIGSISNLIQALKGNMEALEESFKKLNMEEIEERLNYVAKIVNSYPKKIEERKIEYATTSKKIDWEQQGVDERKEKLKKEKAICILLENIFKEEKLLGYIEEINELKVNEAALFIIKNFSKDLLDKENEKLNILHDFIGKREGYLIDYNLKKEYIFGDFEKNENEEFNRILSKKNRLDLTFKIDGATRKINRFNEYLEEKIETMKLLISEEERKTLEDTLIETLSTKISARIYNANSWVKDINKLMSSLNTSNGLKLRLIWKAKTAENEMELNSKELTDLLNKADFISQEQKTKISNHFKVKLKNAKRIASDLGENKSYQSIIKEVLDYRQWYEFKLEYEVGNGGKRKELTDNDFFRLSGGEKAMSMYIPLFAAVNSRYSRADKKECPRIIALDEAFAGVDEENISGIFELLEGLELDYVLNSQVLWGTYSTVNNLAIYEIIREGEELVVPIKYKWNGKVRSMEA